MKYKITLCVLMTFLLLSSSNGQNNKKALNEQSNYPFLDINDNNTSSI